jgi:hypothetical protein
MLERWLKRFAPRGHCRLSLSRETVTVQRSGAARQVPALFIERPLPMGADASAESLAASIAAALDAAGGSGLPVHITFADALVRYFIVTPADNGVRMQDLRAAAAVRFQTLYGDDPGGWQLAADWQAAEPFLACAVSRLWSEVVQRAVSAGRGCIVSATPEFVAAWNRSRRELGAGTWLATRGEHALTLGLIATAPRPRVAAVRTLVLPKPMPSINWLREQVARAALLDNLPVPSTLLLHGPRCDAWLPGAAGFADPGIALRWSDAADRARSGSGRGDPALAAPLAWSGPAQ